MNRRTAIPAILAVAAFTAGTWWFTSRDDARVENCREFGIESMARLERCRESRTAMREEIEAHWRAERQQVLERFAAARQKLNHTTSYAEEARRADGQLPDLMRTAGLESLDGSVNIEENNPERIEHTTIIQARIEAFSKYYHYLVWAPSHDIKDRNTAKASDELLELKADVSKLSDAERELINDACGFEYDYIIYGTIGCPVIVRGELVLEDEYGTENQLTPDKDEYDWPHRTPVLNVELIRFQEPPERIDRSAE